MSESISLKARAKVNLTLDVTGKREDGYHTVEMIMQQVDLFDVVTMSRNDGMGIVITSNVAYLPTDSSNIVYKAIEAVCSEYGVSNDITVDIDKRIPVAAGLAGGSSNAAAVIVGMNKLFNLGLSEEDMKRIGLKLGADVPFCISGGAAIARGIGEELEPIGGLKGFWIVLAKPQIGVSTKEIYSNLSVPDIKNRPKTAEMVIAMDNSDIKSISENLRNVLEDVTVARYPVVKEVKSKFKEFGAKAVLMSGSGPTVFAIFKDKDKAMVTYRNLKRLYTQTYMVESYDGGWEEDAGRKGNA